MANSSVGDLLWRMSTYLDVSRPEVKSITVNCVRRTALRNGAKPKKRGGPLYYREREVICTGRGRGK